MQPDEVDPLKDKYGDALMIQSREVVTKPYTDVGILDGSWAGKEVRLMLYPGGVHSVK
jgi:hypothetical protein